jgi:hypothetical protein
VKSVVRYSRSRVGLEEGWKDSGRPMYARYSATWEGVYAEFMVRVREVADGGLDGITLNVCFRLIRWCFIFLFSAFIE